MNTPKPAVTRTTVIVRQANADATLFTMTYFPKIKPGQRAFRKQLTPAIPVQLIVSATDVVPGRLLIISVNGGCATVEKAYAEGIIAAVRFHTAVGCICGIAELLKAEHMDGVAKQPFRFVGLEKEDYQRLQAVLVTS